MIELPDEKLPAELAELTTWTGPAPRLWERALATARGAARATEPPGWRRLPRWVLIALPAACLIVVATTSMLPSLSRSGPPGLFGQSWRMDVASPAPSDSMLAFTPTASPIAGDPVPNAPASSADAPAAERHVIRKATIELSTPDVRAAFLMAAYLIREAGSEYVEESALTGVGREAQANLTLRVRSERLDGVLNELRALGTVVAERREGQDVTAQVVDVEARARNEQRVETELLQLLERRKDAPLKEILELRDKIAAVRGTIEQLTTQRERLGRLVSLATVLVLIRTGEHGAGTREFAFGRLVAERFGQAWRAGLTTLVDSSARLFDVVIGGLIWWALLGLVAYVVWRRVKA